MSKNKNYYSIHKNKKPKLRLENANYKSIYDVFTKANELVKNLVELKKSMLMMSKIVPKYKLGCKHNELAIIGNNSLPEIFTDKNGKSFVIGSSEKIRKAFE